MNTAKVYTHQVPCINSIVFKKIRPGYYAKGKVKSDDYFKNQMDIDFEFHMYEDNVGHLILRWGGNEQIVDVKYYGLYNLRIFKCPLGCQKYTTEIYCFDRSLWGCAKCLKLTREKSLLRARKLANNPDKLFKFLNKSKRANKKSVGIAGFYLFLELFKKALRRKKRNLKGIRI